MTRSTPAPIVYEPDEDVMFERVGDDILLLHLRTNRFYELNRTAVRVWELISNGICLDEAVRQLSTEFDRDAAAIQSDVEAVIRSMEAEKLLRVRSGHTVSASSRSTVAGELSQ